MKSGMRKPVRAHPLAKMACNKKVELRKSNSRNLRSNACQCTKAAAWDVQVVRLAGLEHPSALPAMTDSRMWLDLMQEEFL